jgi:DNA helicase-2/ATP-dependent DNA helicase PcrA
MPVALLSPANQRRLSEELHIAQAAARLVPGVQPPYFAHLSLESAGRESHVLLGRAARSSAGLAIVDWSTAPLAEVFFGSREGETYELEVAGRTVSGTVIARALVGFDGNALSWLQTEDALLSRRGDAWHEEPARRALRPRPASSRALADAALEIQLDAAQRRAVELPLGRDALVLGEAGCGKTTVALHRLAHLRRSSRRPLRAAVIVPTEGLRRLVEQLLDRMAVFGVEVDLYDAWAARQARRVFPDIPARESAGATGGSIQLKRDPAVREALEELATRPMALPDDEGASAPATRACASREDLHHLFGDLALLARVVSGANGRISKPAIAETFEHTRVQFSATAEEEFAHVDAARLRTLDGLSLDEGTPMEDAQSIDVEDYAVLFELDRLRAQRLGRRPVQPQGYDLLVIDEAQELAPLELALLGRSLAPEGTAIVAGDAQQRVDPTASFASWDSVLRELGRSSYEAVNLEVGYRCPPPIADLARRVARLPTARAGPLAESPLVVRSGFSNECHLLAWLTDELQALQERDASIFAALILRSPDSAARFAKLLRRGLSLRTAIDGRFDFSAGLCVTCVQEVKGLEFDTVIVPDAAPNAYPDDPASRRALYVAITRATRQLALATAADWSPILESAFGGDGAVAGSTDDASACQPG